MNLLLRPLDNVTDPVWSVIILVIIAVGLALGYVVYIMREAFSEESKAKMRQAALNRKKKSEN